ncbi:MAG TPA: ABC transporter permease subunit, partial [Ktedonobacteraceae bacterium]|nr:ABC transporter permease subunit [Ktedonobacteraceae bacterium]
MFRTIWSKSLRDYRIAIPGWGLGFGLIMLAVFSAADPAIVAAWATLASGFRFLAEPYAMNTPEGFVTFRVMELVLPVFLCIWAILAGARLLRGEEEQGSLDLVLATPLPRTRLLLEKVSALILALLLIALLFTLGSLAGEASLKIHVDSGRALLAGLNLSLLAFFFATLTLLISQFTIGRGVAAGWGGGLLVLSVLLDSTGRVVDNAWVKYLSPFYYYNRSRPFIVSYDSSLASALLLLGLSLLFLVLGAVLFAYRDSGGVVWNLRRGSARGAIVMERSLKHAQRELANKAIWLRDLAAQGFSSFWWIFGVTVYCVWASLLVPSVKKPLEDALKGSPVLGQIFQQYNLLKDADFLGAVLFSFMPLFVLCFAMMLAMRWVGDLDNGRVELVLCTPRSRVRMLLERFGAILLPMLLTCVCIWLAIVITAPVSGLDVDQRNVLAAGASLLPMALIVIGLTYALAGRMRYVAVISIVSFYLLGAYMLEFLKALFSLPEWVMNLSIFHLYGSPITQGMNWGP